MAATAALSCTGSQEAAPARSSRSNAGAMAAPARPAPRSRAAAPPARRPRRAGPSLASRTVVIQPLGKALSPKDVDEVARSLRAFYGIRVKVLPRMPLPRAAYYRPRRRYRAEKLLDHLAAHAPRTAYRILGLTAADISTTKGKIHDWGIMGLATLDGRVCVISRFRCARGARDAVHARHRLAKTAVHEIGHTLGLDHCPNRGCLLEDGRGTNKTTDREYVLCAACRRKLRLRGIRLPPSPTPPWPRPRR